MYVCVVVNLVVLVEWTGEKVRDGWCDGGALTSASQKAGLKSTQQYCELYRSLRIAEAQHLSYISSRQTLPQEKNLFYVYKYMYS